MKRGSVIITTIIMGETSTLKPTTCDIMGNQLQPKRPLMQTGQETDTAVCVVYKAVREVCAQSYGPDSFLWGVWPGKRDW